MPPEDPLIDVLKALETAGVTAMITGGYAVGFWGHPRYTNDIDFVVEIDKDQIEPLCAAVPQDEFLADPEHIRLALRFGASFNFIHAASAFRADFFIRTRDAFGESRWQRKQARQLRGHEVFVTTPEDLILMKLLWHRDSESERQLSDAVGIIEVQGTALDFDYLQHWVDELALNEVWNKARALAERIDD